jgi:hypothetical protein
MDEALINNSGGPFSGSLIHNEAVAFCEFIATFEIENTLSNDPQAFKSQASFPAGLVFAKALQLFPDFLQCIRF